MINNKNIAEVFDELFKVLDEAEKKRREPPVIYFYSKEELERFKDVFSCRCEILDKFND